MTTSGPASPGPASPGPAASAAAPTASRTLRESLAPVRELAAVTLLGVAALLLLAAFANLVPTDAQRPGSLSYALYLAISPPGFLSLVTVVAPVVAVVLVTSGGDPVPRAKLVTALAAAQLAVVTFFGLVFELLVAFVGMTTQRSFVDAVKLTLPRAAALLLAALALVVLFRIWQGMFAPARPAPGQAGWSGYGYPGQYPQATYGQAAAASSYPQQPGYPSSQSGQPSGYGQAGHRQPAGYGQASYGQPTVPGQASYGQPTVPGQPGYWAAPATPGTAASPPATGQAQPPATGQAQPPATGQAQPPATGQAQPPATGQAPPAPAYQPPYRQPTAWQPASTQPGVAPVQPASPAAPATGQVYGQPAGHRGSEPAPASAGGTGGDDPDRTSLLRPSSDEPAREPAGEQDDSGGPGWPNPAP